MSEHCENMKSTYTNIQPFANSAPFAGVIERSRDIEVKINHRYF